MQAYRVLTPRCAQCAKEDIAAAVSAAGGQAWSYRFHHNISFGPEIWIHVGLPQCVTKVCHTAELVFVFGNTGDWEFTEEERAFSDTLIDAWTNFAHTGNPSEPPQRIATSRRALRQASPFDWPPFSNDTRLSLVLRPGWDVEDSSDVCAFWDGLGYAQH